MKKYAKWTLITIIWLAVWQAAAMLAGHEVYLSSPLATIKTLFSLFGEEEFFASVGLTLLRILCGFACGMLAGVLFALLSYKSSFIRDLLKPVLYVVKATPVASFIILALVWFSKTYIPILTSALIVIPVAYANIFSGLMQVDAQLLEMADCFKMNGRAKLKHIYLPSLRPYFNAAVKSSLGMAWKAGVAAEVIASPQLSIGSQLFDAKIYLETDRLFAWTIIVILLSVLIEKLIVWLLKHLERRSLHA